MKHLFRVLQGLMVGFLPVSGILAGALAIGLDSRLMLGAAASFTGAASVLVWELVKMRRHSSSRGALGPAPASWLVSLLQIACTHRAFERIFSQMINDGRDEYYEALMKGRRGVARYRLARLYGSIAVAIIAWIGVSAIKTIVQMWKAG